MYQTAVDKLCWNLLEHYFWIKNDQKLLYFALCAKTREKMEFGPTIYVCFAPKTKINVLKLFSNEVSERNLKWKLISQNLCWHTFIWKNFKIRCFYPLRQTGMYIFHHSKVPFFRVLAHSVQAFIGI